MTRNCWRGIPALYLLVALTLERTPALRLADKGGLPVQTAASKGECVVTGRILAVDGTPVDRAWVRLIGSDVPWARIAVTDSAGRFTFAGLPAGSFAVSASKAGYVTTFYGSLRHGLGPAVPVALTAGKPMALSMTLLRGAILSGVITGEFGQPMPQAQVQVKPVWRAGAGYLPGPAAVIATTDDRGAYRIIGLTPGEYVVAAMVPNSTAGEVTLTTDDEVQWALQELSRGLRASTPIGRSAVLPPVGPTVAHVPMYYPGTPVLDDAGRITLGPGEERSLTFSVRLIATSTISGTVVTSTGKPTSATLFLLPKSDGQSASAVTVDTGVTRQVAVSEEGRFAISGVQPGINTLVARRDPDDAARVAGPSAATLWGQLKVVANGRDVRDLVVTLHEGASVTGTVRFESKAGVMAPDFGNMRVSLSPTRPLPTGVTGHLLAPINQTGAFAFPSLMPASYTVKVTPTSIQGPAGAQWTLKSAVTAGQDITDGYLEVGRGDNLGNHHDVALTLTARQTELSGVLFDAANRPTAAFSVVVFSTSPAFWTKDSRRVRVAQPATDGTFRIVGLPPGPYYVVGVVDVDGDALRDPETFERLRQSAFQFTLADDEKRSFDLKVGGG